MTVSANQSCPFGYWVIFPISTQITVNLRGMKSANPVCENMLHMYVQTSNIFLFFIFFFGSTFQAWMSYEFSVVSPLVCQSVRPWRKVLRIGSLVFVFFCMKLNVEKWQSRIFLENSHFLKMGLREISGHIGTGKSMGQHFGRVGRVRNLGA